MPLEVQRVQGAPLGLTEAAEEAVLQWRFEPAVAEREPVRTWTTVRIPFEAIPFATPSPPPAARQSPTPLPLRATLVASPTPRPSVLPAAAPPVPAGSRRFVPPPAPPEPPSGEAAPQAPIYRARRAVRLGLSPEQARVFLDGRYIGIVDDWDNHAGGLILPLTRGPHLVRLDLPGYRPFEAEIDVTSNAELDVVELGDDLVRTARIPFARLTPPIAATRGTLSFAIDPPDAVVSVNGGPGMPAASLSQADPLELPGPGVHEITLSAPGRVLRTIRVMSSKSAPTESAIVRLRLNPR